MATKWPLMELRGPVVTDKDVDAFEKSLGLALPSEYRQFLLDVNGGSLDESCAGFAFGVVNRLFCLKHDEESWNLQIRAERARKSLPHRDLLFVGHDEGGAKLLLMLSGDHRGEVWFLTDPDVRPPGSNPRVSWHDRRDMKKVAATWSEFLAALAPL